jgi:hypothetical protein
MPIKKYLKFEDAKKDIWVLSPDKSYYTKIKELFALFEKLHPHQVKRGITKYKNLSEIIKH